MKAFVLAALTTASAATAVLHTYATDNPGSNIRKLQRLHSNSGWAYIDTALQRHGGENFRVNDGFCMALAIQDMLESGGTDGGSSWDDSGERSPLSAWLWARMGSASDNAVLGYRHLLAKFSRPAVFGGSVSPEAWRETLLGAQGLFFLRTAAFHSAGLGDSGFPMSATGSGLAFQPSLFENLVAILRQPSDFGYVPPPELSAGARDLAGWLRRTRPSRSSKVLPYASFASFADLPEHARLLALHLQAFLHGVEFTQPFPGAGTRAVDILMWQANDGGILFQCETLQPDADAHASLAYPGIVSSANIQHYWRYPEYMPVARLVNYNIGAMSPRFIRSKDTVVPIRTRPVDDNFVISAPYQPGPMD